MAFVEKRFVVVAEVPVAVRKVKFWRVDEDVARRLVVTKLVVVAFVDEALIAVRFVMVDEALTMMPIVEVGAMYEVVGSFQALPKLRPSVAAAAPV